MTSDKRAAVEKLIREPNTYRTNSEIAATVGVSRSAVDRVRQALRRHGGRPVPPGATPPGVQRHDDGSATVNSDPTTQPIWTPESILEAHGMNPAEWIVVRARGNRWGDVENPYHQLRVDAVPVSALVVPAQEWAGEMAAPRVDYDLGEESLIFVADHHVPHFDSGLHSCIQQFLHDERPQRGYLLGDIMDFTSFSRHRPRSGWIEDVNVAIQSAHDLLREYREASPQTVWRMLRGNHDDRLEHKLIDQQVGPVDGIRAADDMVPALSLRRLLGLDGLAIELVDEDWDTAQLEVTPTLTAMHGEYLGPNAGRKTLDKHTRSQIYGHGHKAEMIFRTRHDPIDTRVAVQCPTAADISGGLGYERHPDWQQGIVTGYVWEDGDFALAINPYVSGKLLMPDGRRYFAEV